MLFDDPFSQSMPEKVDFFEFGDPLSDPSFHADEEIRRMYEQNDKKEFEETEDYSTSPLMDASIQEDILDIVQDNHGEDAFFFDSDDKAGLQFQMGEEIVNIMFDPSDLDEMKKTIVEELKEIAKDEYTDSKVADICNNIAKDIEEEIEPVEYGPVAAEEDPVDTPTEEKDISDTEDPVVIPDDTTDSSGPVENKEPMDAQKVADITAMCHEVTNDIKDLLPRNVSMFFNDYNTKTETLNFSLYVPSTKDYIPKDSKVTREKIVFQIDPRTIETPSRQDVLDKISEKIGEIRDDDISKRIEGIGVVTSDEKDSLISAAFHNPVDDHLKEIKDSIDHSGDHMVQEFGINIMESDRDAFLSGEMSDELKERIELFNQNIDFDNFDYKDKTDTATKMDTRSIGVTTQDERSVELADPDKYSKEEKVELLAKLQVCKEEILKSKEAMSLMSTRLREDKVANNTYYKMHEVNIQKQATLYEKLGGKVGGKTFLSQNASPVQRMRTNFAWERTNLIASNFELKQAGIEKDKVNIIEGERKFGGFSGWLSQVVEIYSTRGDIKEDLISRQKDRIEKDDDRKYGTFAGISKEEINKIKDNIQKEMPDNVEVSIYPDKDNLQVAVIAREENGTVFHANVDIDRTEIKRDDPEKVIKEELSSVVRDKTEEVFEKIEKALENDDSVENNQKDSVDTKEKDDHEVPENNSVEVSEKDHEDIEIESEENSIENAVENDQEDVEEASMDVSEDNSKDDSVEKSEEGSLEKEETEEDSVEETEEDLMEESEEDDVSAEEKTEDDSATKEETEDDSIAEEEFEEDSIDTEEELEDDSVESEEDFVDDEEESEEDSVEEDDDSEGDFMEEWEEDEEDSIEEESEEDFVEESKEDKKESLLDRIKEFFGIPSGKADMEGIENDMESEEKDFFDDLEDDFEIAFEEDESFLEDDNVEKSENQDFENDFEDDYDPVD